MLQKSKMLLVDPAIGEIQGIEGGLRLSSAEVKL